jgi:hypothetical protein
VVVMVMVMVMVMMMVMEAQLPHYKQMPVSFLFADTTAAAYATPLSSACCFCFQR